MTTVPKLETYSGITVVRDDLYPGGTKARIFEYLYGSHPVIAYACAAYSRTQVNLAKVASQLKKEAVIFVPARKILTPETKQAKALGAVVYEIRPGYLNVVQKRAKEYCFANGVYLAPLGFDTPGVIAKLGQAALSIDYQPEEVWCAAGSGVLSRALQAAWPRARHVAVCVGKACNTGGAMQINYEQVGGLGLEQTYDGETPFPSDRHYDAKAWHLAHIHAKGKALFWNVLGE